jgi:hypothetical protein
MSAQSPPVSGEDQRLRLPMEPGEGSLRRREPLIFALFEAHGLWPAPGVLHGRRKPVICPQSTGEGKHPVLVRRDEKGVMRKSHAWYVSHGFPPCAHRHPWEVEDHIYKSPLRGRGLDGSTGCARCP